jgi:hypothetical protein
MGFCKSFSREILPSDKPSQQCCFFIEREEKHDFKIVFFLLRTMQKLLPVKKDHEN